MAELTPQLAELARRLSRGELEDMTDVERAVARLLGEEVGVRKMAMDSLIVAWFPFSGDGGEGDQFAELLSRTGGGLVDPADVHLTLLYLGDAAHFDVDLVAALVKIESVRTWPLEGRVTGLGRFVGEGDEDVNVALVDVPRLEGLRRCLLDQLICYGAFSSPYQPGFADAEHGYLPHLTLGYVARTSAQLAPLTETIDFKLDSVTVAAGGQRFRYELRSGGDMEYVSPEPYLAARDVLTAVRTGRALSERDLSVLQAAHAEVGAVIQTELARAYVEENGTADGEELDYVVTKATDEKRYTFGPLYAPDRQDAHGEWTDPTTLQEAVWGYVQECVDKGSNRLNLQHGEGVQVGRWVDVCAWPYETTVKMTVPGEAERELTLPAGTVYMGVVWDEDAWDAVKTRKLTGLSLGGKAVRVREGNLAELEHMGDKLQ